MKKTLWALAALPLFIATAQAASFDCARARQASEIAICSDRQLNDLDVEMSTTNRSEALPDVAWR
ncbi:hypothetical protein [Pseudomonas asplenii]|uniref:hypothetical protein n=1 Tax=Pseudomonas asplenii TaxID=53407 RepID=UPI0003772C79